MFLVGKFHPLLVHLPIGFLLIGLILYWWETFDTRKQFSNVIAPIFILGFIAATLSCITGFQLMNSSEYNSIIVERHRNLGISLACISFYVWYLHKKNKGKKIIHFFSIILLILIIITGHYGGTLTHGAGFLSVKTTEKSEKDPVIVNINDALVYKDLIQPILKKKCIACHGSEKTKGNLRLDSEEHILKGGKNGTPISSDALLLKRILLPPDDDEHMPPKEKGQLTNEEIQLITWWIKEGANFKVRVKQLHKNATILAILNKKTNPKESINEFEQLPEVAPADAQIIQQLKAAGATITAISSESNLLHVNLVNVKDSTTRLWVNLAKVAPQLFTLKADLPFIKTEHIQYLANANQLRKLSLKGSNVDDTIFKTIQLFSALQSLNVSNTKVTLTGLSQLENNKHLRFLYILNILDSTEKLNLANVDIIDKAFDVPTLNTDTITVKESK